MIWNPRLVLVRRGMSSMTLVRYMWWDMRVKVRLGRLVTTTFGTATSSPAPTIIIFVGTTSDRLS